MGCCTSSQTNKLMEIKYFPQDNQTTLQYQENKKKFNESNSYINKLLLDNPDYEIAPYNITEKEINSVIDLFSKRTDLNLEINCDNLSKGLWNKCLDNFLSLKITNKNVKDLIFNTLINNDLSNQSLNDYINGIFSSNGLETMQFGYCTNFIHSNKKFLEATLENLKYNSKFDTELKSFILLKEDLDDDTILSDLGEALQFSLNLKTFSMPLRIKEDQEQFIDINKIAPILKGLSLTKSELRMLIIGPLCKLNIELNEENQKLIIDIINNQKKLTVLAFPFFIFNFNNLELLMNTISKHRLLRSFIYGGKNIPIDHFNLYIGCLKKSYLSSSLYIVSDNKEQQQKMFACDLVMKSNSRMKVFLIIDKFNGF